MRLDIWLDIACLFRTRSEAQKACRLGKVEVNGTAAKPHRELRVGDALTISRPLGRKQLVTVRGFAETHIAKADARLLYFDQTPAPTPEEIEARRMERLFRASVKTDHSPTRDLRRQRIRDKQRGG